MRQSDDDQGGLVWELGLYFLAAAGGLVLFLNFGTVKDAIVRTIVAEIEKSDDRGAPRSFETGRRSASPEASHGAGTTVELRSDRRGHFQTDVEINGRRIDALVDTGASLVVLTYEDAQRAGVSPRERDYTMRTQTANGIAKAAPVVLDRVEIGPIQVRNVQAAVAEPGRLQTNLLGMTFLSRLQKFEVSSGRLTLSD